MKKSLPQSELSDRGWPSSIFKRKPKSKERKSGQTKGRADTDEAADKLSTLDLIVDAGAWPLVLIPILGTLAFACAITGIVLGAMALSRGGNKLKAILGIVLGGLFLVFATVALIVLFFTLIWVG
ncbi:MAG: hypothetical protein KDD09_15560 [Phaeodactylibacter sp.]|nr:hypothetical protein [Phaeodactylibacter sp.]